MRSATIERNTKETQIKGSLKIEGKGRYEISTGIRFLDHMLELFSKHGGFDLKIEAKQQVGAPLMVRYSFAVPRFARVEENGKLVLGAVTFPSYLGRRFVQLGSRRTPLYIGSTEQNHTVTTAELPPGYVLSQPLAELKTKGKFGQFVRRERQDKNQLQIEETFRLEMSRIPIAQYEEFARFAGEVDLVQARDLVLERP